jgi:hypothetical protein
MEDVREPELPRKHVLCKVTRIRRVLLGVRLDVRAGLGLGGAMIRGTETVQDVWAS